MDGDICDLPTLVNIKENFGAWLMVDEAHSIGMLGRRGRGVTEAFSIDPARIDIITGSLSKTIPSNGGFIAGSAELIIYLQHGSAPFMFSAALSPPSTAAAIKAFEVIDKQPELLTKMRDNAEKLRSGLHDLGYDTRFSESSIIPVMTGDEYGAVKMGKKLLDLGVFTTPVIYPSVPRGKERLRLCATAALSQKDLQDSMEAFRIYRNLYMER
jgi:7-keto-8-aminopelargonate synthetase-like enzyme